MIALAALTGFRIVFKLLYNEYAPFKSGDSTELIIYGAGEAGIIVKRSVERNVKLGKKVVAFLDDNKQLHGKTVEGVKIYSPDIDFNQILKNDSLKIKDPSFYALVLGNYAHTKFLLND